VTITRRAVLAVGALAGGAALIWLARQASDAASTSDTAVIESYTLLASEGRLVLGPYSRFQWHHPGPLYFYFMAPFYVLSGFRTAGLGAAAIAINALALLAAVRILTHRASAFLAVCTFVLLALYLWRSAELLSSPWNPHVPVVPLATLAVAAADVVAGHIWTLPLVAALASLTGQTHVGLLPSSLAIGVVASVGVAMAVRAGRSEGKPVNWLGPVASSALVILVFWLPSISEQLTGQPGNLSALWSFFAIESHGGQGMAEAVSAWSDMLAGFARRDFYVAHGWRLNESPVRWAEAFAVVQFAGLAASIFLPGRERFERALALVLLPVTLLALWSVTRIEGAIFDHEVFWISAIGVLNSAVLVSTCVRWLRRPVEARSATMMTRGGCWVLACAIVLAGVLQLREAVGRSAAPGDESEATRALADDFRRYLVAEHLPRPLIRIDQDAWGVAAGVVLRLQKAGVPVAVEDDWIAMFTPAFGRNGHEPAIFTIVGPAEHVRLTGKLGDTVIASRGPFHVHRQTAP
jgi:hypothetical protein